MFDLDGPNASSSGSSMLQNGDWYGNDKGVVNKDENGYGGPEADHIVESGELTFSEDVKGGMGRHLGLFSTTFLM